MTTVSRYRVPAMDCGAEEQLVRMALADVPGIDHVDCDLEAREVAVTHATERGLVDRALDGLDLGATHVEDADATATATPRSQAERPALVLALVVNAVFFVGEIGFGLLSGSMGVVADGLDMGADAAVYALALTAVGTAASRKRRLARWSGWLQLGLAITGLVEVVRRFVTSAGPPETTTMAVVAALALVGNVVVLVALRRVRTGEAHIEASWIFTANDVRANLLVLAAAGLTALTASAVPDLVAGAFIFLVVANGARRIFALTS